MQKNDVLQDGNDEKTDITSLTDNTTSTEITNLKEASSETHEETTLNKTFLHKIKQTLASYKLNREIKTNDELDDSKSKKVKRNKLIIWSIILPAIFYLGLDYILFEEVTETVQSKTTKKEESNLKDEPENKKESKFTEMTEQPIAENSQADPQIENIKNNEISPQINTEVRSNPVEPVDLTKEVFSEPTISSPPDSNQPTEGDSQISDPVNAEKSGEIPNDLTSNPISEATDQVMQPSVESSPQSDSSDKFTQDILQDLEKQVRESKEDETVKEYVSPPNYEYVGRGLVYNCPGKHWACVDGPSFKSCEDNNASIKYLKKKVECHPYNVYESIKICENMQNRMVSSSAKTTFCDQ